MDLQITPSQRQFNLAHQERSERLWWGIDSPLEQQRATAWFSQAWRMLDGVLIRHTIEDIQGAVCRHFKVPRLYMESTRRTKSHYMPRSVAMYLCSRLTNKSSSVIGRSFGDRDHTTVLHNIKVIEKMIALNHPITKDVKAISKKLGALS